MQSKHINLVIGCGYLGRVLLDQLYATSSFGFVQSKEGVAGLAKDRTNIHRLDINQAKSWPLLAELVEGFPIDLYVLVPPRQINLECFEDFVRFCQSLNIHKAVLTSSTVVYGQMESSVNADSDVCIDSDRAEQQYAIERTWHQFGGSGHIVRLAGLYGPDRIIGQRLLEQGRSVAGDPEGFLNLIHVADAARLLLQVVNSPGAGLVELGADGSPIRRQEYYTTLAGLLQLPVPDFNHAGAERGGRRRCDIQLTIARTGWQPQYPNALVTIEEMLRKLPSSR